MNPLSLATLPIKEMVFEKVKVGSSYVMANEPFLQAHMGL
jgi:hypothetical protein